MKIPTYYKSKFFADTPTLSMRKLSLISKEVQEIGLSEIIESKSDEHIIDKLTKLHSPKYVEAFVKGEGHLASSNGWNWTKEIRDGVLAINESMVPAAEQALSTGISSCIAAGFHHSSYDRGSAYCTFNGLALVAQELPDKRVFVLDVDIHFGDGTRDFTRQLDNLYNFSIFGLALSSDEETIHSWSRKVRSWIDYEAALAESFVTILDVKPDLIIYQAGMDAYIHDSLGSGILTKLELQKRDRSVFEFTKQMNIPIVFVMAGGYNEKDTVSLHVETFKIANEVYYGKTIK